MKQHTVTIGGRTFALAFTLDALCSLQDMIDDFDLSRIVDYVKTPKGMLSLLTAMAEQGEALEGRILDVDRHWFGSHTSPSPARIAEIQAALLGTMTDWMMMETDNGQEEVQDAVLQEIKKNGTAAG